MVERTGDFVCCSVTDTGVGIAEADLPKIFEPFFTTKEVGKGTGLGLATVYGILEQHQGWVEVRSKPGQGTTFEFYLPAAEHHSAPAPKAQPSPVLAPGKSTILLVEDEDHVRRLTRYALTRGGYFVVEANSGPAALSVAQKMREIDLLLTDVVMPEGINGAELAERLRATRPGLPIILVSGYSEFRGNSLEIPAGARFLQKPYSTAALLKTVAAALPDKARIHRAEDKAPAESLSGNPALKGGSSKSQQATMIS
jgi:CheY-like chemotaxis protein